MNLKHTDSVPLSKVVKAAAIDLSEDLTRVEATFSHFAVRGLQKLSDEILRLGSSKKIIPIHQNYKTASMPIDCNGEPTFVGYIDDCGYKVPLRKKTNIVGEVEEIPCEEKCSTCNQDKDICEDLNIEEVTETVTILGQQYQNTITKYFEGNGYYEVKKTWVLNIPDETVEQVIQKKFITDFDKLSCGCLAKTEENEQKLKLYCYDCYCTYYMPCREDDFDEGGYRYMEETNTIQFDKNIEFEKVYVEYPTCLPKKNGVYHVPKVSFEALVAYVKFKHTQHKQNISLTERALNKKDFIDEKANCLKIIGRVSLNVIINSIRKTPKFN